MDTLEIIGTIAATGASSAGMTIAALRVHILYLRETVHRHNRAIERAHERIDALEKEKKHS
jgi:hypothetical protein